MKPKIIFPSMTLVAVLSGLLLWNPLGINTNSGVAIAREVTVYKSPTCGCCANYAAYLKRQGFSVKVIETNNMDGIKSKYNIPHSLESCHTSVVDDYIVEGHIPFEIINKLIDEKPAVTGIGMSGMPSGSPGMPGAKTDPFMVYSFDGKGNKLGIFSRM
jgi:hypothetical protein